jgi:hypothetical protein
MTTARVRAKESCLPRAATLTQAALLAALLGPGLSLPAEAGAPCDERHSFVAYCERWVSRECTEDGYPTGQVYNMTAVPAARRGRSAGWVRAHIRPLQLSPAGCDWLGTMTRRFGSASSWPGTVVLTPTPGSGSAASPAAAPEAPPARRDAWTRVGPTRPPATVAAGGPYRDTVEEAARRYRLPADLVQAVMHVESGGNPRAVSVAGAIGLMQLLPDTAAALGVNDPYDPAQSIAGGARFLRLLANRFQGDLVKVLSAYHAGSTRVERTGATPWGATDDYVRRVLKTYYALQDARGGRG